MPQGIRPIMIVAVLVAFGTLASIVPTRRSRNQKGRFLVA
jgi:hypothetical protein